MVVVFPTEMPEHYFAYKTYAQRIEELVANHPGEHIAIRNRDGQILGYGSLEECHKLYYTLENVPILLTEIPKKVEDCFFVVKGGILHYLRPFYGY